MNKKYVIGTLSVAILAFLIVITMIVTTVAVTTVKDVQEITVFQTEAQSDLASGSPRCSGGAQLENAHSMFTFCFLPKGMPFNVTEVWISLVMFAGPQTYPALYTTQFYITLNSQSQSFDTEYSVSTAFSKVFSLNISNPSLTNSIQEGINFLQVNAQSATAPSPVLWYRDLANEITIFIEYEYQPENGIGVGGLWIPVDKLSLLAPYIVLVLTLILAIAESVAYIKHRKKQ